MPLLDTQGAIFLALRRVPDIPENVFVQLLLVVVKNHRKKAAAERICAGVPPNLRGRGAGVVLDMVRRSFRGRSVIQVCEGASAARWAVVVAGVILVGFGGAPVAIGAHIGGFLAGLALARPLLLWRWRGA